jgi:hypothetical protein
MADPQITLTVFQNLLTNRIQDIRWRIPYPRHPIPAHVDLRLFPHVWIIPLHVTWEEAHAWCTQHAGELDHEWTWTDTSGFRFSHAHVPVMLNLVF